MLLNMAQAFQSTSRTKTMRSKAAPSDLMITRVQRQPSSN
jgi:hypothetical protein